MSDSITRDWEQIRLKDLGELSTSSVDKKVEPSERQVSLINYMDVYRNDFIDSSVSLMPVTASISEVDRFQIKKDDVLFTPSSETPDDIGHAALVLEDMPHTLHSYHTVRFRQFSSPRVQGRFAGHVFKQRGFRAYVARHSTGSTRYTLSLAEFGRATISVPPADEQAFIAQILDTLDTQIRQTEALITKLERIKQGLLTDLLTRGIDQNGQLRPAPEQAPNLYKDSSLGRIPKEWVAVPLDHLAENLDGKRVPIKKAARKQGIYPYYGASGIIDWVDGYIFDGDYVLLGEDGENVISRRLPLAFRATGKIWVNNHAHIYEPKSDTDIRFLLLALEEKDYSPWVLGSAQPKLTQKAISFIRFPKPPLPEQQHITDKVESLDQRIDTERRILRKLGTEKIGLMDDLLTGRVRVTRLLETAKRERA